MSSTKNLNENLEVMNCKQSNKEIDPIRDGLLSVRALNCLKAAEVETLGELVSYTKSDLMKFRNFGKKSLTELEELVHAKGLNFGFDVAKYKLEADK